MWLSYHESLKYVYFTPHPAIRFNRATKRYGHPTCILRSSYLEPTQAEAVAVSVEKAATVRF